MVRAQLRGLWGSPVPTKTDCRRVRVCQPRISPRRVYTNLRISPGERLPQFPKPTHGLGLGLKPFATINQVISRIPRNAPDHDVRGAESRGIVREPFDPNQQARTITTGGGDNNYHPSGLRGFTNREFACLQTFPLSYKFGSRQVRKQIGNAVPPMLAEALYREIIRSLECSDTEEMADPEVARPSVEIWFS